MFDALQDRMSRAFKSLRGKGHLTDADIEATLKEIRVALLEADVNLDVVKLFINDVREQAKQAELSKALNPSQQIVKIVHDELVKVLGGSTRELRFAKTPPTVIMLAGLQGVGKTTLAGKLAAWLIEQGHTPLLVAADLQRPNAVTQLQVVGQQAGAAVYAPQPGNGIGDPVAVARDGVDYAHRRLHDVVIVDTAGRLGVDEEMLRQAAMIREAVNPHETLFVVDAMIGQDAVMTANSFARAVGFDGVVLTKLDGDARGGAALSVATVTGAPIMFVSTGEKLDDFDVFHPDRMAGRILDMGDILTLIEQAERVIDQEAAAQSASKLLGGGNQFTLQDFLEQMRMIRRMGPLSKIFSMLPGMGQMGDQLAQVDEKEVDRIEAIISSMTPQERADVSILNGSRRARIARGAGVEVSEVNSLVNRFVEARKMMSQMGSMMGGGMPGASALPGAPRAQKKQQAKKKKKGGKGVSGNPAKRNATPVEEAVEPAPTAGAAFGLGPKGSDLPPMPELAQDPALVDPDFTLPPELQRMFEANPPR
ncbi:MAG: signal recognition particle protein [Propionibacteriaceae bacterium]|jgi:signal recognition particle subunit SRP54|nr:signal recognition particle protein [Propionibacteriaceae bacterium]